MRVDFSLKRLPKSQRYPRIADGAPAFRLWTLTMTGSWIFMFAGLETMKHCTVKTNYWSAKGSAKTGFHFMKMKQHNTGSIFRGLARRPFFLITIWMATL